MTRVRGGKSTSVWQRRSRHMGRVFELFVMAALSGMALLGLERASLSNLEVSRGCVTTPYQCFFDLDLLDSCWESMPKAWQRPCASPS